MNELNITPDQKRALSIIFAVMIGLGSFYYFNSRPTEQVGQALIEIPAPVETITTQLIINVAGKVTNPGVYQLPQGSRVIDAIKAAGNQLRGVDISVGEGNSYGHPDGKFITELANRGAKVWRTDQSGGISVISTNKIRVVGKEWWKIRWG